MATRSITTTAPKRKKAIAQRTPDTSDENEPHPFYAAHGAYLAACSSLQHAKDDRAIDVCLDRIDEALFTLSAVPVSSSWMIQEKAKILLDILDPGWFDKRDVRLLGNIIADLKTLEEAGA